MENKIISDGFIKIYENRKVNWGFNGLGFIIYKKNYARTKEDGKLEEWPETIQRCINGAQKLGADYTKQEAERLFDYIFNLKCCFSGRGLWQLGTRTVDILGVDSLLACWGTKISTIDDLIFVFTESILGGGVGCNVSREYTYELPRVKKGVNIVFKNTNDADYIVSDSKEGWGRLWRKVLESFLITGESFSFSTVCIRPPGTPLKTFGGKAPGAEPLINGVSDLTKILKNREGKKLRTDDVTDIICCAGQVIKSGGIRRSALILAGDVDDISFLNLKRWDLNPILPSYRSNANNSLLNSKYSYLLDKYWEAFNGNGEAYGLVNLKACKKYGRLGETSHDGFDLYDDSIIIVNPCGEATLGDKEACNLAELMLNNITSKEEMLDCATLLYKTQKAIAAGNYIHKDTNKIIHKNMRLGLGVTGICQNKNYKEWCDYTYKGLRKFDKKYSKDKNWNQSIRLTVCKPSGTLSILSNSTPGVNPGYSKYHYRTVRFGSNEDLLPILKECGYKMEPELKLDNTLNHDIIVVYFPCSFGEDAICESESNAIDQLERIKSLQTTWADQAISNTVYYKPEELPIIKDWLSKNYDDGVKTVSFQLHTGHGFKQPVLAPLTKDEYNNEINRLKINKLIVNNSNNNIIDSFECSQGVCPIK